MPQPVMKLRDLSTSRAERFTIKTKLGNGAMGEVFLADDGVLKREVALKVIRREHSQDTSFQTRLLREAERASRLNDEHIARIYDVAEHEGRPCLIMEYVEGQTLRSKLREPLATEEFFSVGEQCLAAVAYAHRRGVLHCDLKPENLMITPAGLVKILDFGLARKLPLASAETLDSLEPSATPIGGTLGYMAPEVLLDQEPDQRADIFSIGVILYEALTGSHPFWDEGAHRLIGRMLWERPRPLSGPVLAGLDVVLLRMMARDPAERYQTCADALADLRAVHEGRKPGLQKPSPTAARRLLLRPVSLAAVVIALLLSWPPNSTHPVPPPAQLLVVLPFRPISEAPSDIALTNGLTETLTAKLGRLAERYPVDTVPASDVRAQKVTNLKQARAVLGATLVLDGSLQQSGRMVRVSYSLVDTRSQRQLHSDVITADASNPFAVQDQVLAEVVRDLDIDLTEQDLAHMTAHGTTQPQAYSSYLRGRGYLQEYDRPENLDNAIAAFQAGLKQDPGFALAYAGLGQAYLKKYDLAHAPETVLQARDACTRAVELQAGRPEGEICLGMLFNTTGRYVEASEHLERAASLDPGNDNAFRELALTYEGLKRVQDAETALKKAIALRPLYWAGYKRLGWFYSKTARGEQAVEQFKRVVELAPDNFSGYSNLGAAYVQQGKYGAAIEALERSISLRPTPSALSNLGAAYFCQGQYQEAARTYEDALKLTPANPIVFGNLAEAYGQLPGRQKESRTNYSGALELAEQQLRVNANDSETLSYAALYAAHLDLKAKAEQYRKAALKLSDKDPYIRKNSALALAQFHQDNRALAELDQAVSDGLPASEIKNDPAWQRFETYPRYKAIMARARKR